MKIAGKQYCKSFQPFLINNIRDMALEITGKLQQLLPLQKGTGAKGEWTRQEFIIETVEQYPKKVCVSAWGDKANDLDGIKIGETLKVSVNIESREYNGKWYTDVRVWRIEREGNSQQAVAAQNAEAVPTATNDYADFGASEEVDDLPF